MPTEDHAPDVATDPRDRVLSILQDCGEHATSFQILESGYRYWFDPEVDAVVAWVEAPGYRVVAGPPVAPAGEVAAVTRRFVETCEGEGRRALFFSADEAFIGRLEGDEGAPPFDQIAIGEQPEFEACGYDYGGRARRSLRSQCRRAGRKVEVRRVEPDEVLDPDSPTRAGMLEVLEDWEDSRRMAVMGFMVDIQLFRFARERRYYVAEREGRVEAFLVAVPVYGRDGWFLEDVIRRPSAPNGTSELLIYTAITDAGDAGEPYVTLGLSPLANIPDGPGPHPVLRGLFRLCERELGYLYGFTGLRRFKRRFRPERWSPQYVVVSPPRVGVTSIAAVLKVFAGRSLLSFSLDTARRLLPRVPRWFYLVLAAWACLWIGAGIAAWAWLL